MLYQIVGFILQIIEGLIAGTCLLRLLFHYQKISLSPSSGNPLGPFVFSTTNWLVLPIRRFIPAFGRLDTASLLAAYVVILCKGIFLWLIAGASQAFALLIGKSIFDLLNMSLSCLNGLVLIFAVMSWIQTDSGVSAIFARLVCPMLRPIQNILPLIGGIDLSPLALLALIQIAIMVLGDVEPQLLSLFL